MRIGQGHAGKRAPVREEIDMGNPEVEMTTIMNLIVDAGSARSFAMEAIGLAKAGSWKEAEEAMKSAGEELAKAHRTQTDLIQQEAKGNRTEVSLFMVHAQDHIMTAMLARDLAQEIVELYQRLEGRG